jgi:rubredoxin
VKCALCGLAFAEAEAKRSCRGCPMSGGCGMLRCPNCGYEAPVESGLAKLIKGWRRKKDAA